MYEESMAKTGSDRNYADRAESSMATANGTSKLSGIDREYSEIVKGLAALQENVADIERRLAPILRNEPPMPSAENQRVRGEPACPLAESISRDASFLRESNRRIESILRRIEV
jgi:hypothetical protein